MIFEVMKDPSPQSTVPQGPKLRRPLHESSHEKLVNTEPTSTSRAKFTTDVKLSIRTGECPSKKIKIDDYETDDYSDSERVEDDYKNQQIDRHSVEPDKARQEAAQYLPVPPNVQQPKLPKLSVQIAFIILLAVLTGVIAGCVIRSILEIRKSTEARQSCQSFLQLNSKYPNTDDMLWTTLIVGVERAVNNPGEPATFIFLYNSSTVGQSLLNDVIRITIECFGNGDAIWRTSSDFKSAEIARNYEAVLERHRAELRSQGILVVRDLDQVPPIAAQIFFTICDPYEPLVRKAAIFFTIDISQRSNQSQRSPTSIAESILKELWRDELHANVLDPLLVRLTENVFRIE